jgi:hypothetical protein
MELEQFTSALTENLNWILLPRILKSFASFYILRCMPLTTTWSVVGEFKQSSSVERSYTFVHFTKICMVPADSNSDTWLELTLASVLPCLCPTVKHHIVINVKIDPCETRALPENIQDIRNIALPLPRDEVMFFVN